MHLTLISICGVTGTHQLLSTLIFNLKLTQVNQVEVQSWTLCKRRRKKRTNSWIIFQFCVFSSSLTYVNIKRNISFLMSIKTWRLFLLCLFIPWIFSFSSSGSYGRWNEELMFMFSFFSYRNFFFCGSRFGTASCDVLGEEGERERELDDGNGSIKLMCYNSFIRIIYSPLILRSLVLVISCRGFISLQWITHKKFLGFLSFDRSSFSSI